MNYLAVAWEMHGHHFTMPFELFWSLSVEEQYYLIFPILLATTRGNLRSLVAVVACLAPLLFRFVYAAAWPQLLNPDLHFIYFRTETRIDSIATGVLVAVACETAIGRHILERLLNPAAFFGAIALLLFSLAIRDPYFRETLRYTLQNLACATILCTVVFSNRVWVANWLLNSREMVWVGLISYSLYVWHQAAANAMDATLGYVGLALPAAVAKILCFLAIFAMASTSYFLVEKPIRGRHRQRAARAQDQTARTALASSSAADTASQVERVSPRSQ